ncbi:MAG: hypothetical protein LBF74_08590 [Treponema sp.]|jgi:hypothetical protein|nr:hypothetical protein [Treponema sp.]
MELLERLKEMFQFSRNMSDAIPAVESKFTDNDQAPVKITLDVSKMPCQSSNQSLLGTWESGSPNINFGQYLKFTRNPLYPIPFWMGLNFDDGKLEFMIWFEKETLSPNQIGLLSENPNYGSLLTECWVSMDDSKFTNCCDTNDCNTATAFSAAVADFMYDVLSCL